MRHATKIAAFVGVTALLVAGCGSKPSDNATGGGTKSTGSGGGSSSGKAFNACMVLDTGGIDDRSFNQSSYAGYQAAAKANPSIKISYVPSNSGNDYAPNLSASVNKGCQAIVAAGGLLSDAVKASAKQNPNVEYGVVDGASTGPNVYGLTYNTAQGAFLGGYLAAAMSKTGTVATFGGLNIPPVTIYMDGFWEGVQYYNKQKGKHVKVLGWNENNQKGGTFANNFSDQNKGLSISNAFIQQGADILFPVAGGTGLGAGAAAQAAGGSVSVIWVDTDGCVSASQYCQYFLTSVTKGITASVQKYISAAASGHAPKGNYVGTLANGGTGLAPFHNFASKVPSSLKSELNSIKADIISGKIKIHSPSQPQ